MTRASPPPLPSPRGDGEPGTLAFWGGFGEVGDRLIKKEEETGTLLFGYWYLWLSLGGACLKMLVPILCAVRVFPHNPPLSLITPPTC